MYFDRLICIRFVLSPFRSLQNEVEELEELHKMKDSFYDAKITEMKEFKEKAENFVVKCEMEVESLRNQVNEVTGKSKLDGLFLLHYSNNLFMPFIN